METCVFPNTCSLCRSYVSRNKAWALGGSQPRSWHGPWDTSRPRAVQGRSPRGCGETGAWPQSPRLALGQTPRAPCISGWGAGWLQALESTPPTRAPVSWGRTSPAGPGVRSPPPPGGSALPLLLPWWGRRVDARAWPVLRLRKAHSTSGGAPRSGDSRDASVSAPAAASPGDGAARRGAEGRAECPVG